jgi:hypothetical protein
MIQYFTILYEYGFGSILLYQSISYLDNINAVAVANHNLSCPCFDFGYKADFDSGSNGYFTSFNPKATLHPASSKLEMSASQFPIEWSFQNSQRVFFHCIVSLFITAPTPSSTMRIHALYSVGLESSGNDTMSSLRFEPSYWSRNTLTFDIS